MPEQVRRGHRDHHAGGVEGLAKSVEDVVALGGGCARWDQVVIVEADSPAAEIAEAIDELPRLDRRAHDLAERIPARVSDGPESEGELVLGCGLKRAHRALP